MSNTCYLSVYRNEGVVFDDLAKLNEELSQARGISELIEMEEDAESGNFLKDFTGWIKQDESGVITLSSNIDNYFYGYDKKVEVWGCWSNEVAKLISKHMTAGELIMRFDEEGWDERFWVINPKIAEERKPKVTF